MRELTLGLDATLPDEAVGASVDGSQSMASNSADRN
jgi:hypothetical protein